MDIKEFKKKKKTASISIRVEKDIKDFIKENNLDSSRIFQERIKEIMKDSIIQEPTSSPSSSFSQPSS